MKAFEPKAGSHIHGQRLSECQECASVSEHDLRNAECRIAHLEAALEEAIRIAEKWNVPAFIYRIRRIAEGEGG